MKVIMELGGKAEDVIWFEIDARSHGSISV